MKRIAFIGTGVMGRHIAGRLMDAGYPMQVYEVKKKNAQPLIDRGAAYCASLREAAAGADVIISMLGYPRDVEQVYFGEGGLFDSAAKGAMLIDMTTSSPALARRIAEVGKEKGMPTLDAPVSGGPTGAEAGTLSIMVGGEADVFDAALPLFEIMGQTITLAGGAGMGQNTKMANQIAVGSNVTAVAEAFAYAKATGLDPAIMFRCVSGGAGGSWQMSNMAGKMMEGDDKPGFFIRHLIKDMDIVLAEAETHGVSLPLMEQVREIYGKLAADGLENCGTQAVYHYYD